MRSPKANASGPRSPGRSNRREILYTAALAAASGVSPRLAAAGHAASSKFSNALPDDVIRARLGLPKGQVSMVLDSDTYNEVDDQFALAYAIRSPDRIALEAVYAAPFVNQRSNTPAAGMEKSYQEIFRVFNVLGVDREQFVFRGSQSYLAASDQAVESPAARDLVKRALEPRQSPLLVVGLGAATNIASAIVLEPRIIEHIVVLWIGGQPYSWPIARDFNLGQDIAAARVLFDCGVPLVHIPAFNVSEHLRTTIPELALFLRGKSAVGDYLLEIVEGYYRATDAFRQSGSKPYPYSKVIWDIATIALLNDPGWVSTEITPSPILTEEGNWQRDDSRHPVRVATRVARDAIFQDLFVKLAGP